MKKELSFETFCNDISGVLQIDAEDIKYDLDVYQELGIDSLGLVTMCNQIFEFYKIEVPAADMVEWRTMGQLYEAVVKGLSEKEEI